MASSSEDAITDQAIEDAVERKRDELHREIAARIRRLIDSHLPPTPEKHALSDPRRIPQSERAAFLKKLESL
jgi:hypothetical protein